MHIADDKLRSLLTTSGLLTDAEFEQATVDAKRESRTILDSVIGSGKIAEHYVFELLQKYYGVPLVDLKKIEIPEDVLALLPELYAKTKRVILFASDKATAVAKLAMVDPLDYDAIEYVRSKIGAWVEPYLTTPSDIQYALKRYSAGEGGEFTEALSRNIEATRSISGEVDLSKTAESVPIVSMLDSIMEHAVTLSASDIHFEPLEDGLLLRFRVDGTLQDVAELPSVVAPLVVARVKILTDLRIDEHRMPQDGRFQFKTEEGGAIDVRVNVMPVFHGEKVEMRLLRNSARPLTLHDLGLSDEAAHILTEEIQKPHGMVLVTGPTGHGKTTTLYALLHILNTPSVNITTIEDPIEYEFPRVNQTQVNPKAGVTFANGLRALLRQNPDIIMIGEIRDNETVEIAVHAALTGHLVLSSLHTNDAPSALPRLLDMGAPAFLLSSTVNVVVAQRLVRKICTTCIVSYDTPKTVRDLISAQIRAQGDEHITHIPDTLYKGNGCQVCGGTGLLGQIGIFEIFRVSDAIRDMLLKESPISDIRKQAIKEGMTTMFEDGLNKAETGITTIDEVLRVVRE